MRLRFILLAAVLKASILDLWHYTQHFVYEHQTLYGWIISIETHIYVNAVWQTLARYWTNTKNAKREKPSNTYTGSSLRCSWISSQQNNNTAQANTLLAQLNHIAFGLCCNYQSIIVSTQPCENSLARLHILAIEQAEHEGRLDEKIESKNIALNMKRYKSNNRRVFNVV